jgi:hypothetical protein
MDEDDDFVPEIAVEIIDERVIHLTRCTLHQNCSCPEPSKKLLCTCSGNKCDKCAYCYMLDDENDNERRSCDTNVNNVVKKVTQESQ